MNVSIFVDGQNTWHSLKKLNSNLTEEKVAWITLFSSLLYPGEKINTILWFRPAKVEEIFLTRRKIAKQLIHERYKYRKKELLASLNNLPKEIFKEVKVEFSEKLEWLRDYKNLFNSINSKYIQFTIDYPQISIYRSGILKVDPYNKKILGEKGVDVAMAIKIVEHIITNQCDRVILVSGDSDYEEVIKIARFYDKKIFCVKIGNTMSHRLKNNVDGIYEFTLEDFTKKFSKK